MNKVFSLAWLLAATVSLSSCGGGDTPALQPLPSTEVAPDGLDYPDPNTFVQGIEITPLVPRLARGVATNYLVAPDLPAGLRLRHDGVISGTPLQATAPTTYLVTAGNSAGTSSFGVRITISGRYTLGGIVVGLTGTGLVLTNNGIDHLPIDANGSFTFAQRLTAGADYSVSVSAQPAGQACSVSGGSGSLGNADLGTVVVSCSASPAKAEARRILYVSCPEAWSLGLVQGYVVDRATGTGTPLGELIHRYVGTGAPGSVSCGPYSVSMDADGSRVYVSDPVTRVVSVYATSSR